MLSLNGGKHPDSIADPKKSVDFAIQWAHDYEKSLSFFSKELDSPDSERVKTSLLCISLLTYAIEYSGPGQSDADSKSKFEKAFPLTKMKAVLAAHPEYEEWIYQIRKTKYNKEFQLNGSPKIK
jgi:hypothetical protein